MEPQTPKIIEQVDNQEPVELEPCSFCHTPYPPAMLKQREYYVKKANLGRITSKKVMCDQCFEKAKDMINKMNYE